MASFLLRLESDPLISFTTTGGQARLLSFHQIFVAAKTEIRLDFRFNASFSILTDHVIEDS